MNTILIAVEDESGLRLPSGEDARKACGISNRQTWKKTKQTIGVTDEVMTEKEMVKAVVCQLFLSIKNRQIATHKVFSLLQSQQSLDQIINGLSEFGIVTSYEEIVNSIKENHSWHKHKDLHKLSEARLNPSNNPTVTKLSQPPSTKSQKTKREPLLVL
jgi:hypothetical protein